jgi:potassium-transporting ATPase potassium-binding subunit
MLSAILFVVFIVGTTAVLSWTLGSYMKWAMDPDAPGTGAAGRFTSAFQRIGGRIIADSGVGERR